LIHMNGRVYDQELGRFLSADPFVQSPFMTNSFNRYSYVMNNPLKYTDPTGFIQTETGANDGGKYADYKGNTHEGANSRRGNGSKGPNHPDNDPTKPTAGSGEIATEQEIADLGLEDGRVVNSIDSFIDNFFSVTDNYNNYQETAQSVLDADLKTKLKAFAGVTLEMSVTTFVGKFKALKPVANAVTKNVALGAKNPATAGLLKQQLTAEQIAKGHAFEKHVLHQGQFPDVKTKKQFAEHIESVMENPTHSKALGGGRHAYFDSKTSTFAVTNPKDPDAGTAFQTSLKYFNNQK